MLGQTICERCHFPPDGLTHLHSIAGDAACERPVFRPLKPGEVLRKLTWRENALITFVIMAGIAFIGFMMWLGTP